MSSRPFIRPYSVISNGNMTSQIISTPTIIDNISLISYDISWAGTAPVGSMSVQVSNTYTQNAAGQTANPGNWTTLTLSAPTPVTGNTGNGGIDVDVTGFYAIRLVYTPVSGTGTLNAVINAKVC